MAKSKFTSTVITGYALIAATILAGLFMRFSFPTALLTSALVIFTLVFSILVLRKKSSRLHGIIQVCLSVVLLIWQSLNIAYDIGFLIGRITG